MSALSYDTWVCSVDGKVEPISRHFVVGLTGRQGQGDKVFFAIKSLQKLTPYLHKLLTDDCEGFERSWANGHYGLCTFLIQDSFPSFMLPAFPTYGYWLSLLAALTTWSSKNETEKSTFNLKHQREAWQGLLMGLMNIWCPYNMTL